MQIKLSRNPHAFSKLVAVAVIGLCGSDALAQSGSRGAASGGSASRAISQAAPTQSFQQPASTFQSQGPSFAPQQNFAPAQSFSSPTTFSSPQNFSAPQNFAPAQSFSSPQTFAPSQGFSSPQQFGANQTFAPAQPSMQPMTQGATGGGSPGIPQSSLVDPIFEMHDPNSGYVVDHSAWNSFLQRYLVKGPRCVNRINYRQVTACDRQGLNCYLQRLQSTDTRSLNRDEQLAFWFNLYNAKTA